MHSRNIISKMALAAVMLLPLSLLAQSSSIQAFSPYTFYGVGDLSTQGTSLVRSMGGAGVAYRSPLAINYLNPASNSAVQRQTFLFNFGLEGQNFYNKSDNAKTSFNTFNIRDVAVMFPLAKKIGFSFSTTPFSSVGYRVEQKETDPGIIANLGDVTYQYQGEGNITQFKAGVGMEVFKGFSIGAEAIYYLGNLDRSFNTLIMPITQGGNYSNMSGSDNGFISKMNFGLGFQYSPLRTDKHMLTVAGTYTMASNLKPSVDRYVHSNNIFGDTVMFRTNYPDMKVPEMVALGVSFVNVKWIVNADYVFQGWGNVNRGINYASESGNVAYRNTNTFKAGAEYTPNRGDVRRYYNRISYRVGLRYADSYLKFNGENMADKAVTFGFGVPIRMAGTTNINLGFELGERGTTRSNLIKERYFKFSIGLSLFDDYWFRKYKYQ